MGLYMWKLPEFNSDAITSMAAAMESQGYVCIEGAVPSDTLEALQEFVKKASSVHNESYFAYHGIEKFKETPLATLAEHYSLVDLMAELYRCGAGSPPKSSEVFPVLRCVQGSSGLRESNAFHFDASLVTALVPIFIPQEGDQRGDLLMFPNLRMIRSNVFFNVIEKAIFQNRWGRSVVLVLMQWGWLRPTTLRIVPGNIYFFWGYRSLHANEPCDPAARRATAVLHFGDPHSESLTTRMILKLNQRRARIASKAVEG